MRPRARLLVRAAGAFATTVLLSMAAAGCGGSDSAPKTTPPPTTATSTSPSAGQAEAAIEKAFVDFFAGTTGAEQKVMLVENGSAFAAVINRQAGTPLAEGTTATVSSVAMLTETEANVVYTVSLDGTPALKDVTGVAVNDQGTWKVSAPTFCALLKLEQQAPPICKQL